MKREKDSSCFKTEKMHYQNCNLEKQRESGNTNNSKNKRNNMRPSYKGRQEFKPKNNQQ